MIWKYMQNIYYLDIRGNCWKH